MASNRSDVMGIFLLLLPFCLLLVPTQLQALNTDGVLLLSFKYSILDDPSSALSNWNYGDATPCSWTGVTCTELGNPSTPDMFRVTSLVLPNRQLLGSLSPTLFSIPHLKVLDLSNNNLSRSLPDFAFNSAAELRVLSLGNNNISGELPENISALASLQLLNLSANAFTGKIPRNLTLLKNLTVISLTSNYFSGDVPSGFEAAQVLDLSSNLLTGTLPLDFAGRSLRYLSLSRNSISGRIANDFAEKVPANAIIDLSFNNLTGPIPESLPLLNQKPESFDGNPGLCGKPLKNLCSIPSNLSNPPNNTATTSPAIAVMPRTHPPTDPLTESPNQTTKSKLKPSTIVGIIVADIVGLALLGMFILYVYQLRKRRSHQEYSTFSVLKECLEKNDTFSSKKSNHHQNPSIAVVTDSPPAKPACGSCIIMKGGYDETSASDANSSESDIENQPQGQQTIQTFDRTDGEQLRQSTTQIRVVTVDGETNLELDTLLKASAYVLGSSGSVIVYKAVLENGASFAVRRIGTETCAKGRFKEFEREVRKIAKLRHPNLVRVRGFCWGDDEKLLISDYVPNGSLPCSITRKTGSSSSQQQQGVMSLEARLKIAKGIAQVLAYVHEKKFVHGDIKPNNILLSPDAEPIITDLGLNRLISPRLLSNQESNMAGSTLSPSVGPTVIPYRAPESLKSQSPPTPKWDVYSFGVVLLELLTGKVFAMDRDLVQLSNLFESGAEEKGWILRSTEGAIRADVARHEDVAMECFRLGFRCVSFLPQKRPSMKEVSQALEKATI